MLSSTQKDALARCQGTQVCVFTPRTLDRTFMVKNQFYDFAEVSQAELDAHAGQLVEVTERRFEYDGYPLPEDEGPMFRIHAEDGFEATVRLDELEGLVSYTSDEGA